MGRRLVGGTWAGGGGSRPWQAGSSELVGGQRRTLGGQGLLGRGLDGWGLKGAGAAWAKAMVGVAWIDGGGALMGGTFVSGALPQEGPRLVGGGAFGAGRRNTHSTARAEPFTVWDLGQRRVEAVQVVGRGAGVAAEQLAAVLAHAAELHVVVLLLLAAALVLVVVVVLRLPLDPFLLLEEGGVQVEAPWARTPPPPWCNPPSHSQPPHVLPGEDHAGVWKTRTDKTPTPGVCQGLTQWGQLHLPSGAFSSSGSRQTRW